MAYQSELQIKSFRLLHLCSYLQNGQVVNKRKAAEEFNVTERSIQRDIKDLRNFFENQIPSQSIIYDAKARGYRLTLHSKNSLDNGEVLAVCKILLESRSMVKKEMYPILDKLISCCVPEHNKKEIKELVANEKHHYISPQHDRRIMDTLWDIGQAIRNCQVIEIQYERIKAPNLVTREIEPVGIMFSEYYFYLTAFIKNIDKETRFENKDDLYPTIYRVDRIQSIKILSEHFYLPYKDRFEEGEFRKRVQFMYGGCLEKIKFRYRLVTMSFSLKSFVIL